MQVVKEMDAGPVLDVEKVDIERLDTGLELERKLSHACVPLVERCLPLVLSGKANPRAQNEEEVSYVRKLAKEDGTIDFGRAAAEVSRRINGLFPWPGTRFDFRESTIKVGLADFEDEDTEGVAGQVIGLSSKGLAVACGSGVLFLKRLQRPGGKMLDAQSFVRGFDLPVGTILDSVKMSGLVSNQHS